MSFVYTPAKTRAMLAGLGSTGDMRVLLAMTNTTLDTEEDDENIADTTTLDEMDGSGYVRKALASEAVSEDTANNRAEFDADDVTWSSLGAGTRQMAAILLYKHVTNDADALNFAYIDSGGFPLAATGADFTAQWNAEGIMQAT